MYAGEVKRAKIDHKSLYIVRARASIFFNSRGSRRERVKGKENPDN